jgi:4-amino-4-deoxy-L-arabinose transferase-like glycosyltransferase
MMREQLIATILFALLLGSAAGWGRLVLALFQRWQKTVQSDLPLLTDRQTYSFLSLAAGLGILSWLGLLAGLANLYFPITAWLVVGLGFVGFYFGPEAPTHRDKATAADIIWRWPLSWPLLVVAAGSLLYSLLVNTLVPPHEWDEVAYHLALPQLYVEAGRLTYVPFIVHSNWPMNTEMLFTWSLLLGSDLLAHYVTWSMTLLTGWGLYEVGRRFLNSQTGIVAATLYLTIPLVIRLSGTGLIDMSLAFYGTAALLAYGYFLKRPDLPWLGLAGLFAGLTAGSKLMGGAYPLLMGLLLLFMWLREQSRRWQDIVTRLLIFGGIGFLMVGPWYGRSYLTTGNPTWPFMYHIFGGGPDWDDLGDQYHTQQMMEIWAVDIPTTPYGLLQTIHYMFSNPVELGGYTGGTGQLLLLLLLPGLLWAWLRWHDTPTLIHHLVWFSLVYYLIWFLFVSRQIRFLFAIFPLLCLIAAFGYIVLWQRWRTPWLRFLWAAAFLFFLFSNFVWLNPAARAHVQQRWPVVTGQVSREEFLAERVRAWTIYDYANQHLPEAAYILLLPYENRGYYLARDYIWGHPASQRIIKFEQYDDVITLADDLRAMGITHIIENPEWIYEDLRYWEQDRALMLALQAQCTSLIKQSGNVLLLELEHCE